MSLLLLFSEPGAPPPPVVTGPRSRLGLNAVPRHEGPGFPNRAPQTILAIDPAVLTWTGQALNAADRIIVSPADLRWIGLTVPSQRITGLSLTAVPGSRRGPFPRRSPQTILLLDPATLTWTGQTVSISQDQLAPAALSWIGQEVVVRVRGALRPFTKLGLSAVSVRRGPGFVDRDDLRLDPIVLTWQGQSLTVRVVQAVVCDPAVLTWQGQEVVAPSPTTVLERGLEPLEGVA